MAKAVRKAMAPELVVNLSDPGMTPLLRAGAGGLASSLRAILRQHHPAARWPAPVPLGPGVARVEPQRITISWGPRSNPSKVLRTLFEQSFRIGRNGLIDLPGAYERGSPPRIEVSAALQDGLKRTFLQHGKATKKRGKPVVVAITIDENELPLEVQRYAEFAHQGAWKDVLQAISHGTVTLASWAYPGATQRHIAFGRTRCQYDAAQALSACFAIVGCLSFKAHDGGALVIPEPSDLIRFAAVRPRLTPRRLEDTYVTGTADAVLAVHLALRMDKASRDRPGIRTAHGVTLKTLPWAKQQKGRASVLAAGNIPDSTLDLYDLVTRELPTLIHVMGQGSDSHPPKRKSAQQLFVATSALRGFVTDNLANGDPWFTRFATATTGGNKPRFIHYYRTRDNLGALFPREHKGLVSMLDHLDESEHALVTSVHVALRQRFGSIAADTAHQPAAMTNRFQSERERWRLAFAGAKTCDQIRGALADLWSRAGPNSELRTKWTQILPLLRPEHWQMARDLALIALASYQGHGAHLDDEDDSPADAA